MSYIGNIDVYTNDTCNLTVRDITLDLHPDFLYIALFYTDDAWATNDCDFSNPASLEWNIAAQNEVLYSFVVFHCRLWDPAMPTEIPSGIIVYDNGGFYENTDIVSKFMNVDLPPHVDLTHWTLMTCADLATFIKAAGLSDLVQMSNYESGEVECPWFTVRQTSVCYEWQVCDVSGTTDDKEVTVYEYGSTEVLSTYTLLAGGCVTITLPEDGVFVVGISHIITTAAGEELEFIEYHIVYETCALKTCYNALVVDILCKTWDPCCETGCTEAEKKVLQVKRDTLNQMVALVGYLVAAIWVEHTRFGNILLEYKGTADATRDTYVRRVQQIIDRLQEIIGRCGSCDDMSDTTTTGCSTCD